MKESRLSWALREAIVLGLWFGLLWLGLTAVHDRDILLERLYVIVAASAVAGILGWHWRRP
jgi:hypothetical protein